MVFRSNLETHWSSKRQTFALLVRRVMVGAALSLSASAALQAATPRAEDDAFEVAQDGIIDCQVNQIPAKLVFRGDGLSYPVLNPDAPGRLKLRSNLFADAFGIQATVGTTSIPGHTGKAKFLIANQQQSLRALWFERPIAPAFDGAVGPGALPQARVQMILGASALETTEFALPLQTSDNRMGTIIKAGSSDIFVMFNPLLERSIATAGAGQALALSQHGQWSGTQEHVDIEFGLRRPARALTLSEPIAMGNLSIAKILVRDNANLTAVGEVAPNTNDTDPSEVVLPTVVVTAQTGSSKPLLRLILGQDALGVCSSITFDKSSKRIVLACATPKR